MLLLPIRGVGVSGRVPEPSQLRLEVSLRLLSPSCAPEDACVLSH